MKFEYVQNAYHGAYTDTTKGAFHTCISGHLAPPTGIFKRVLWRFTTQQQHGRNMADKSKTDPLRN